MTTPLVGGPYDAMDPSPFEVRWSFSLISIPTSDTVQTFVVFPALEDWLEVAAGRLQVRDSREYHYYELIDTPDGRWYQYDPGERRYRGAICEATTTPTTAAQLNAMAPSVALLALMNHLPRLPPDKLID